MYKNKALEILSIGIIFSGMMSAVIAQNVAVSEENHVTTSAQNDSVPTDPSATSVPTSAESDKNLPQPMDPSAGAMTEIPTEEVSPISPINSTESVEKKKHDLKVRYNEVRTRVEKEEDVATLRQVADKASTTEGQRQTLRLYYELLFKRMKQIDPALAERCDVMQGAYLRRLEQRTLEPTIPLRLPSEAQDNSTKAMLQKKHSPLTLLNK